MGGSYGNILAIGATQQAVIGGLGPERAYLAAFGDAVGIFCQADDSIAKAIKLSQVIAGDIVGFTVFDDDVLGCALARGGEKLVEFSAPTLEEYFGAEDLAMMAEAMGEPTPPPSDPAAPAAFVNALARGNASQAMNVLGDEYGGDRVYATGRHRDLLIALELPAAIAGWGYYDFDGYASDQLAGGISGFDHDLMLING